MPCQVCFRYRTGAVLCDRCRRRLLSAPDSLLPGGVRLIAAFSHVGPARSLAHDLKYRGLTGYAGLVADAVTPRLPRLPLVPIPRAMTRRIKYGVDPSTEVAQAIALRMGVPVLPLLRPPIHTRRRAGGDHAAPVRPFGLRARPNTPVLVVDDVVTTGATVSAAIHALGPEMVAGAVSANAANQVSSLLRLAPIDP
ncbi:MAG: hypothetical protein U9N56_00855 [Actinomycetota bacterium]|nr:hypothetical protein [Actinomycetota bacterium]